MRFTLEGEEERTRPTVLRECFARLGYKYEMQRIEDSPFHCNMAVARLPGLVTTMGQIQGSRAIRTRAHVEDGSDDAVLVVNLRSGPYLIEQRDRELVLDDGDAVFVSASDPSSFSRKPLGEVLALRFPKAGFAPFARGINDRMMRMIPNGTPALSFLKKYVGIAFEQQTYRSPELQHLVVSHIYDLMALVIGATRGAEEAANGRGLRAARAQAIKNDIGRHLDEVNLSVAAVAERNRMTPRYAQRLFEMEGTTFTEYVLAQRLARVHRLLIDPRRDGDKISAVAYDCGFGDVSYFNRVFRRKYGMAPSDIRAQARQAGGGRI